MIQRESSATRARSHRSPDGPVRTCVGCRRRELAADLLRVAAVNDEDGNRTVAVVAAGNVPGRGAWLHPSKACLHAAIRRRAFTRALRITGSPDTSAVVEWFGIVDRTSGHHDGHPATEQVAKNMSTP